MKLIPLLGALLLSLPPALHAAEPAYKPQLFSKTKLVYQDDFDHGPINKEFWEVRQSTTWEVKDGVLYGGPSSADFQANKKASADPSHAGLKPVIWIKRIPENFVCLLRVRYDAKAYQGGMPLIDLGHHINSIVFSEKATTLTINKKEKLATEQPLFSLNQWHEVAIELIKGKILLQIDGQKHLFESPTIAMPKDNHLDFKAVDGGSCQIDRVAIYEGLP